MAVSATIILILGLGHREIGDHAKAVDPLEETLAEPVMSVDHRAGWASAGKPDSKLQLCAWWDRAALAHATSYDRVVSPRSRASACRRQVTR